MLFLALTGLLSVPFWVLGVATGDTLPGIGVSVSIGMVVCPAVAVTVLMHREAGWPGVRRLWSRVRLRPLRQVPDGARRRWWAFTLGVLPLVTTLALAAPVLAGTGQAPQLGEALRTGALVAVPLLALAVLEEVAWTGSATDPLQRRWGMVRASVVIGFCWAVWHLVPWLQVNDPWWVLWQVLFTVALRVVIVAAYNALGGSLASAVALHAMSNVCFAASGSAYHPAPMAVLLCVAAVLVLLSPRARSGPQSVVRQVQASQTMPAVRAISRTEK